MQSCPCDGSLQGMGPIGVPLFLVEGRGSPARSLPQHRHDHVDLPSRDLMRLKRGSNLKTL